MATIYRYYAVYKPFRMLCQFSPEGDKLTLASLGPFQKDVYPVGRLDYDSEGLLILTNDNFLKNKILDPSNSHGRTYCVQVEGNPDQSDIHILESGLIININGNAYKAKPCTAKLISEPNLPERNPPIRFRRNIPTSWIELNLTEGKNRQVRKMTAAVGYPTLRLIRVAIENLELGKLQPGQAVEIDKKEIYSMLKIEM